MWNLLLITVAALAGKAEPAPGPAARLDLAVVVERMQKRYDQAADFRARFTQNLTNPTFGRTTVSSGEVLIKKPGRMRWNYEKPESQMYLATGQLLWLYQPDDKQAFKQDLKASQLPASVAFLMGKGKLGDEFEITLANKLPAGSSAATDYLLSLKPKQPQGQYKAIYFVVDPDSYLVKRSVLIDAQGVVNEITFSDAKVNTKLGDALFKWSPPPGIKVVDAGKLGK